MRKKHIFVGEMGINASLWCSKPSAEVPIRILLINNYSINVVGNIWEPRKFTRYYTLKRQVNVYASVGTTYPRVWAIPRASRYGQVAFYAFFMSGGHNDVYM